MSSTDGEGHRDRNHATAVAARRNAAAVDQRAGPRDHAAKGINATAVITMATSKQPRRSARSDDPGTGSSARSRADLPPGGEAGHLMKGEASDG